MFSWKTLEELREAAEKAGAQLPLAEDTSCLRQSWQAGAHAVPNRIVIQPMEGCDSEADGSPGAPTRRRYLRLAAGGAGMIWLEACAVCRQGRANPRQLWIREENVDAFRRLADEMRETALRTTGVAPVLVLQLTHSGRYSKPDGVPAPRIACNNPLFEKDAPLPESCIVTDAEIERAEDDTARAAALAQRAGFDGADIKASHRYLGSELLSAFTRPGPYGGSFENRTRFLRNALRKARQAVHGEFLLTSRLNAYDGFPYPYGFGAAEGGGLEPDLAEPIRLVQILRDELGLPLVNITIGNPYVNPHVNRPADWQPYPLPEDPLLGVARMLAWGASSGRRPAYRSWDRPCPIPGSSRAISPQGRLRRGSWTPRALGGCPLRIRSLRGTCSRARDWTAGAAAWPAASAPSSCAWAAARAAWCATRSSRISTRS